MGLPKLPKQSDSQEDREARDRDSYRELGHRCHLQSPGPLLSAENYEISAPKPKDTSPRGPAIPRTGSGDKTP